MRVLYFLFFYVFFKSTAIAQESLGNVVASPNKFSVKIDKVGSSVFYIEKGEIENSSATTTSGLLQEFGGFTIAPKGNKGTDPSYFNRGLSRKYIKVLVDGMDLSDITSTQEEPTYIDNIMLNNVDNIEILNGSQGTLYGGNAIGGVVTINSSLPEKYGLTNSSSVEGGSYSSIKTSNSTKFLNKEIELVFNLDAERSGGYNSFIDTGIAPTEKDGYYLYGSNFLSSFKVRDNFKVNLNGRFYKQHNEYDNNFAYPGDDVNYFRDDKVYALLLDLIYNSKSFSHKLSFQPTYTTRISTSGTSYEYDGRKK
jgi:vitamin B12 transporter